MSVREYYNAEGKPALLEITDNAGNVTAREYYGLEDENGKHTVARKEEYYEKGSMRLVETHRPDGSVEKSTEYLKTGETAKETDFSESGSVRHMTEYSYSHGADGLFVPDGKTDYLYSDEGRKKTVEKSNAEGAVVLRDEYTPEEKIGVRYSFDRQNPANSREIRFLYDSDSNLVLEDEHDGAGKRLSRKTYCSDGSPAVTEEYGEDGRRTVKTVYDTENDTAIRREYDRDGILTAEERFSTEGCLEAGIRNSANTGLSCFDYALMESVRRTEYDRDGNIVSKTEAGSPMYDTSGQSDAKMKTVYDTDGDIREVTVTEYNRISGESTVYRMDENGYTIGTVEKYDRNGNPMEEAGHFDTETTDEDDMGIADEDEPVEDWTSDWK